MRAKIIAANWKMNKTLGETKEFIAELKSQKYPSDREVVLFPPFLSLAEAVKLCKKSKLVIGAQNMHQEEKGAFTGEISPLMLKDIGVSCILLGHSERRHLFKEDNEMIQRKVVSAVEHGFKIIFCVGETLAEREQGKTHAVLNAQLESLRGLKDLDLVSIAYEPVWAIGTGNTASPSQAEEAHVFIRGAISQLFSKREAEHLRILYGGSVTPENAKELLAQKDVDGALIGGSSLDIKKFIEILNS